MFINSTLPFAEEGFQLVINLYFGVVLFLCALVGFLRGTKKSIFYLIASIVFIGGGFLLSGILCNAFLDFDLSFINFAVEGNNGKMYELTSARELITTMLNDYLFNGQAENTLTISVFYGIIEMVFRIVWFSVVLVLSFTVLKIFADFIWLFVRPRKKIINGKKRRPKPKVGSRFGGMGIGLAKGIAYVLLCFFSMAGFISIIETYQEAASSVDDVTYNMVITSETATLVELSNGNNKENLFGEYQEIVDMLLSYKETIPGTIFETIKIGDSSLDEMVFDLFYNIKVDDINTNVKLRKEIQKLAEALAECPELLENGLTMESLVSMAQDEVQNAKLKSAIGKLTELDLIKVSMPVVIEIALISDIIVGSIEDEDLKEQIKSLDIEELKALDYGAEFKNIGYAFVDLVSLLDENGDLDFISMSPDTVTSVFDSIGKLELINQIAPLAVSYVLTSDDIKSMLEEYDIDPEDLGLADIDNWSGEIEVLGDVLAAFLEIGLTNEDLEDFTNIEFNDEFISKIDNFTEVLFTSSLIKNAVPVIANVGISQLPEEYAELVTIPSGANGEYWQQELKPLLKAALALLSTGILSPEEGKTTQDLIKELSNDQVSELALHLSESSILTGSLNNLITQMLSAKLDENGNVIEEGMLGDIVVVGFDSSSEWTKEEIENIFTALISILKSDIIGSNDYLQSLSALSNETIDELTKALSGSKFITKNLSSILSYLLESLNNGENSLDIVVLEENEWTQKELSSIFYTFREIANSGLVGDDPTNAIKELSDEAIDNLATYISASKFLTRNLTPIMDMLLGGMELDGIQIKGFENYEDWTQLEISSLLKGARIVISYSDDLTQLVKLSEDELDALTASTLITNVLVDFIEEYSKEGNTLELIEGVELVSETGWKDNTFENIEFTYASGVLTINSTIEDVDKYYVYSKNANGVYEKITSSSMKTIDLNTILESEQVGLRRKIQVLPALSDLKVVAYKFGEIRNMFRAIQAICKDSEISADSIISSLSSITDNDMYVVLDSIIVSETIITQLEEYANKADAIVVIPEGDLKAIKADGTKDRSAWLEQANGVHGELFNALKAISILFNGKNISDLTFGTDMFTSIDDADIETVLKSRVINETLIVKLSELAEEADSTIYIPSELKTESEIDRAKWNNANESVNILIALKKMFSGDSIDVNNLSINNVLENENSILKSLVISETIKQNILKVDVIKVPSDLDANSLNGWKNIYVDGELSQYGEISHMLNAIKLAMNIDENTTIESIQSNEISLNDVVGERTKILLSKVLTETIKDKIVNMEGVSLPEGYSDQTNTYNYIKWENTYNSDDTVKTKGEIDALLASVDIIFGDEEIDFNNISLNNVINEQDEILKSIIISQTIKSKILELSEIKVPTSLSKTSLENWRNIYNNDEVKSRGEIAKMLSAVKIALNVEEGTTLDSIQGQNIKLNTIINDRDIVLKSLVFTETIKDKILEAVNNGSLNIPSGWDNEENHANYIAWENTYGNNESIIARGEIDALLAASNELFGSNDVNFDNLGTFDYNSLFSSEQKRKIVLSSKIIAETMIVKIEDMVNSNTIHLPSQSRVPGLYDLADRTAWWNLENGELIAFVEGASHLLTEQEKHEMANFQFGVDKVYNHMMNEEEREEILKSYILGETLSDNFKELELYTQHHANVNEIGVELDNNEEWYGINILEDGRTIVKKELWRLISSIKIILGAEYTSSKSFELDDIFGANEESPLSPSSVAGKRYFELNWTNTDIFLESLLIQTIFEDELYSVIETGVLNGKIISPSYGYSINGSKYLRFEYTYNKYKNENPDSLSQTELNELVEYDTKGMIESIIIMNLAGLNYDELSVFEGSISSAGQAQSLVNTLININWDILVDAFFISRAFRGSIETLLNPIFATIYAFAEDYAMLTGKAISSWDSVKLVTSDYQYPMAKKDAAELLFNDINTIINNIKYVFE